MNLRYNTMNFFVLCHEQFPWYKTTKFRGIIPYFFLCKGVPIWIRNRQKTPKGPQGLADRSIVRLVDCLRILKMKHYNVHFFQILLFYDSYLEK